MASTLSTEAVRDDKKEQHVRGLLVFSPEAVKKLTKDRFAPTYIGVRRVRPDFEKRADNISHDSDASLSDQPQQQAPIVYKTVDSNGVERRMTTQEKKKMKFEFKQQQAEARKRQRLEERQRREEENLEREPKSAAIEQQEEELQNVRDGFLPVLLSPCMTMESTKTITASPFTNSSPQLDDGLAADWCKALRKCIEPAEVLRQREDLRPMAYQMIPEVWTRMRPGSLAKLEYCTADSDGGSRLLLDESGTSSDPTIMFPTMRPRVEPFDSDMEVIYHLLHRYSTLHISCGAKFGCDLLLYDGPRHERHAFAGLRVYSNLNVPTAYDLASYARCLHTAGKLALLATVQRRESKCHVAFVDLVLEKIANTTSARVPKGRRQDISKNLSKV